MAGDDDGNTDDSSQPDRVTIGVGDENNQDDDNVAHDPCVMTTMSMSHIISVPSMRMLMKRKMPNNNWITVSGSVFSQNQLDSARLFKTLRGKRVN